MNALVENCIFADNEVALRLRGPTKRGGAKVTIRRCVIYGSKVGLRAEDGIENLSVERLGFGPKVARRYHMVAGGTGKGYQNAGEFEAPSLGEVLRRGLKP